MKFKIAFSFLIMCAVSGHYLLSMNKGKNPRELVLKRKVNKEILKKQTEDKTTNENQQKKVDQTVTLEDVLKTNAFTDIPMNDISNAKIDVIHWYDQILDENAYLDVNDILQKNPKIKRSATNAECITEENYKNKNENIDDDDTRLIEKQWISEKNFFDFFKQKPNNKKKKTPLKIVSSQNLNIKLNEDPAHPYYSLTLPDGNAGKKALLIPKNDIYMHEILRTLYQKATPFTQAGYKKLLNNFEKNVNETNKKRDLLFLDLQNQIKTLPQIANQQALEKKLRARPDILFWNKHLLPIIVALGIAGLLFTQTLLWGIRQYLDRHPHIINGVAAKGGLYKFLGKILSLIAMFDITNKKHWTVYMATELALLLGILCIAITIDYCGNDLANSWIKWEKAANPN